MVPFVLEFSHSHITTPKRIITLISGNAVILPSPLYGEEKTKRRRKREREETRRTSFIVETIPPSSMEKLFRCASMWAAEESVGPAICRIIRPFLIPFFHERFEGNKLGTCVRVHARFCCFINTRSRWACRLLSKTKSRNANRSREYRDCTGFYSTTGDRQDRRNAWDEHVLFPFVTSIGRNMHGTTHSFPFRYDTLTLFFPFFPKLSMPP